MVRFTISGNRQFYMSLNDGRTWHRISPKDADALLAEGAELIYT